MKILAHYFCLFFLLSCTSESVSANSAPIPEKNKIPLLQSKNELMFIIDEGRKGAELIALYQDDYNALDRALKNICDALDPLKTKYEVSVLIYPNWLYNESGYGLKDPKIGINRIHPALRHTFDYLKKRNIGVYLEMYSSGGYTNQNGELGNLPLVKKHYPDGEAIKSIPMDLECLEDIFSKCDIVKGIRLHELIGTNNRAQKGDSHGFFVDFDFIREMAWLCKKHNKHFVWGDHAWDRLIRKPDEYGFWRSFAEEICEILEDNITINFNINGWSSQFMATRFELPMSGYCGNKKWGYSVQSWYWQGRDAQVLPKLPGGSTRWYPDARLDMPIELMAAFTIETFRQGGTLVQYEPSCYFFNFYSPSSKPIERYGQYEKEADYSGKLVLARLTDILLNYDKSPNTYPPMTPALYYTSNENQYLTGRWSQKPLVYYQTTLGLIGSNLLFYDTYCSDIGNWYRCDNNRYGEWVLDGEVIDAIRVKVDFRDIDELLVVRKNGTASFYNHISSFYTTINNLIESNRDGTYISLTTGNLKQNCPEQSVYFWGDPDEIVVARDNKGIILLSAYEKISKKNGAERKNFIYEIDNELTSSIRDIFGEIKTDAFVGFCTLRRENYINNDNTRPLDNFVIIEKNIDNQIKVRSAQKETIVNINASEILDIKSVDIDCDCEDEIAFLIKSGSIAFYKMNSEGVFVLKSILKTPKNDIRKIFGTRWTSYYRNS